MRVANIDSPAGWRLAALHDNLAIDLNRAEQLTLQPEGALLEPARLEAERRMPSQMQAWLTLPAAERLDRARRALEHGAEVVAANGAEWARARQLTQPAGQATLAPPVPPTATVLAIGLNYKSHATEAGMEIPAYPLVFAKPIASLRGDRATVRIPRASHRIDYEGELAVVIGRTTHEVSEDEALAHVAGYTIANDVSARDWQFRTSELMIGKAFDGFCPIGPCLVTADEIANPHALRLRTCVGGEVRQDAGTDELIFGIPTLVSYLSQVLTLQPGDVILTGTPAGIGASRQPRRWLRSGDVVEVTIDPIGTLTTSLVDAAA